MSNYHDNLNNMICLDIFLTGSNLKKGQNFGDKIVSNQKEGNHLLSYDISSMGFVKMKEQIGDKILLEKLAHKFAWQTDLQQILCNEFEALVLTDVEKQILWVNKGFERMTSYKSCEAVGKKSNFLQGKNTEESTRIYFREKFKEGNPFDLSITNYRKNGEEYLCKVYIFPLQNNENKITHFLALEHEI